MAIDPRTRPVQAGQTRLFLRFESAQHTRAFHHFATPHDGAARRIAMVLNDGMAPDRVSLVDFGFHVLVVEVDFASVPADRIPSSYCARPSAMKRSGESDPTEFAAKS
jgi:hypothetical protein